MNKTEYINSSKAYMEKNKTLLKICDHQLVCGKKRNLFNKCLSENDSEGVKCKAHGSLM